ncbi:Bcr/CflA family efflux MFS transporter [Aquipuribacter nitratireducens]|uniref:Multidrug effflux MFS transporter n=1 Tax=Aquipuribacter nitratireducens TaxID=650104 RepID=A0ABW0GR96_9MICO
MRTDTILSSPPAGAPARPRTGFFSRLGVRELVLLGMITAAGPLTIDLYLPAYPTLAAEFGVAETQIQLTLTACVLGLALGQLVIGPVADRVGRRLPVVVGLAGWAVSSLLVALAPTLTLMTVGRFLQGFVVSAGMVTARAVLRDLSEGRDLARAFARLFLVVGAVPMVAPFLGSLVLEVTSWRGVFVVLAVIGVVLACVTALLLPETLPREQRRPVPVRSLGREYGRLLVDRDFIAPALVASLAFAGLFVYINGSSFVLQEEYGISSLAYGFVFAVVTVALITGSQISSWLVGRVGLLAVLRGAPVVGAVTIGALAVVSVLGTLPLPVLVVGLAVAMGVVGLAMPAASAHVLSGQPPHRAGLASGLVGVLQFAVGGTISPLASAFGAVTPTTMTGLMAVLFAASAAMAVLVRAEPEPARDPADLLEA